MEAYLLSFHVKNANQEYDISELEARVKTS